MSFASTSSRFISTSLQKLPLNSHFVYMDYLRYRLAMMMLILDSWLCFLFNNGKNKIYKTFCYYARQNWYENPAKSPTR